MPVIPVAEASPEAVIRLLSEMNDQSNQASLSSGSEVHNALRRRQVQVPSDWHQLPPGTKAPVVGMYGHFGPAIRWIKESEGQLADLISHDDVGPFWSGSVVLDDARTTLTVIPAGEADLQRLMETKAGGSFGYTWFNANRLALFVAGAVIALSLAIGLLAFFNLDADDRANAQAGVAELAFQLIAIVIAGALVKLVIDRTREWRAEQEAIAAQRESYIRRLIDASHAVDRARILIFANRSVLTLRTQMTEQVIPVYIDLRDLQHDVKTMPDPDLLFPDWVSIRSHIDVMVAWCGVLIEEYANHKKGLSELQLIAEDEDLERDARGELQEHVWVRLRSLRRLGSLLGTGQDQGYADFRRSYRTALEIMRVNHAGRKVTALAAATALDRDMRDVPQADG